MSKKPKISVADATFAVHHADCVAALEKQPAGSVQLAIADPPYNLGVAYDAYEDNKPADEYLAWTRSWIAAVTRVLHKHGSFWIFVPDEWVSEVDLLCRREFKYSKRSHVIWGFGFGVASPKNFARSHCHLLYFTRTKTRFTFHDEAIRVPSDRQLVYRDKRANPKGKLPNATWLLTRQEIEAAIAGDSDLWYVSRICGTFKERRAHSPNQIPLPIMERIVLSTSNPGDLVLDPFAGTGSSGVAAVRHGRRYLGYDVSAECAKQATERIAAAVPAPPPLKRRSRA